MLRPYYNQDQIEAGCDEAGRGCLAGPVVAAAVILPADFEHPLLNDSKKMSEKDRSTLAPIIRESALAYGIGMVSPQEIDHINILNASFRAMHLAIDRLSLTPQLLLIDGNRYRPAHDIPYQCIIKGDGKYTSIAAASVLAKTHRDQIMHELACKYPQYGWQTNVGYPTAVHRKAISRYGPTPHHRMSFRLVPDQLNLFDQDDG